MFRPHAVLAFAAQDGGGLALQWQNGPGPALQTADLGQIARARLRLERLAGRGDQALQTRVLHALAYACVASIALGQREAWHYAPAIRASRERVSGARLKDGHADG